MNEPFNLSESETNPGYGLNRLLNAQPRSVFDCDKILGHTTSEYLANCVNYVQNPYRRVQINNMF